MNLGLDNLRELIEDFLGNSGGRRGREREERRNAQDEDDPSPGDDVGGADADDSETDADDSTDDRSERIDPDELDEDEIVDELYHRIESLEDELDEKGTRLGTIRDSQEQVADQVEEVNDTVRQLLGIYDQLTNDVNPFTDDGETEGGFGVFTDEDDEPEGFGLGERRARSSEPPADETVSFEDLKQVIEDAADSRESSGGHRISFDDESADDAEDGDEDDDTRVEVQATESVDEPDDERESDEDGADDVTLHALAGTYATDVLIFEWLTELVRTAGPAATLRAISYYQEIGWIDGEVQDHLESVLSGPDLDMHVDPGSTPDELTAEDHADSYTYIMKLSEIHETKREAGP